MKIFIIILSIILCLCFVAVTIQKKVGAIVIKIYLVDENRKADNEDKKFIFSLDKLDVVEERWRT